MKVFISIIVILFSFAVFGENIVIIDYSPNVIDREQRESFINEFGDNILLNGVYNISIMKDDSVSLYWNNINDIKINTAQYAPNTVIIFKYYVFGNNFVIKMIAIDIDSMKLVRNDEFSMEEPEELKTVAQKSALMFVHNKSSKELEQVGLMIPNEQKEILEKRGLGLMGLALTAGYMWSTTSDGYAGDYKKVLLISASLPVEVSKNGRMDITLDILAAASIAGTIGYSYISKPTSVTPYFGADAGIEYVYHRRYAFPDNSIGGIVIRPKLGYILMNTYKTSIFIEAAYRLVTDDFFDSGVEFRFGFIFR